MVGYLHPDQSSSRIVVVGDFPKMENNTKDGVRSDLIFCWATSVINNKIMVIPLECSLSAPWNQEYDSTIVRVPLLYCTYCGWFKKRLTNTDIFSLSAPWTIRQSPEYRLDGGTLLYLLWVGTVEYEYCGPPFLRDVCISFPGIERVYLL